VSVAAILAACAAEDRVLEPRLSASSASRDALPAGSGGFKFTPLGSSAVCTNGGNANNPLVLPDGFSQTVVASEPSFPDAIDMNTQNETGLQPGRYLYRVTEGSVAALAVTDLATGVTKVIAQRADWESLDPVVWTPWGTLLFGEETNNAVRRDPSYPAAVGGLVYEVFFDESDQTLVKNVVARPAIGAKSHEGMRFDNQGNLYSISERTPGYIFKFVPDTKGDLSSGNNRGGNDVLYVAITSEHRVLAIDLGGAPGSASGSVSVANYVARGLNTDTEFIMPDNLALDKSGNLYITEDPGGNTASGKRGDDIWVAEPPKGEGNGSAASSVVRFATLTDCEAEPTGIYFDLTAQRLFVNIQHRGGDRLDKAIAVTPDRGKD
jgi:sugar lactone lactonase YvrE